MSTAKWFMACVLALLTVLIVLTSYAISSANNALVEVEKCKGTSCVITSTNDVDHAYIKKELVEIKDDVKQIKSLMLRKR